MTLSPVTRKAAGALHTVNKVPAYNMGVKIGQIYSQPWGVTIQHAHDNIYERCDWLILFDASDASVSWTMRSIEQVWVDLGDVCREWLTGFILERLVHHVVDHVGLADGRPLSCVGVWWPQVGHEDRVTSNTVIPAGRVLQQVQYADVDDSPVNGRRRPTEIGQ